MLGIIGGAILLGICGIGVVGCIAMPVVLLVDDIKFHREMRKAKEI